MSSSCAEVASGLSSTAISGFDMGVAGGDAGDVLTPDAGAGGDGVVVGSSVPVASAGVVRNVSATVATLRDGSGMFMGGGSSAWWWLVACRRGEGLG